MAKKAFKDCDPAPTAGKADELVAYGSVHVADNGMVVVVSDRDLEPSLTIIKGKAFFVRIFEKPITKPWLARRINEFADYVKEFKLPRGPRAKNGDPDGISAPIKRIRLKKEVA